jgi:hypothetical protein
LGEAISQRDEYKSQSEYLNSKELNELENKKKLFEQTFYSNNIIL